MARLSPSRGAITSLRVVVCLLALVGVGCRQGGVGDGPEAGSARTAAPADEQSPTSEPEGLDSPAGEISAAPSGEASTASPEEVSAALDTTSAGPTEETASPIQSRAPAVRPAAPEERRTGEVTWMQIDEAAKKVNFDVIAGLTPDNSAWNFNGYANGGMTLTVPKGWTVTMKFSSRDADVPHSLYIIEDKPPYPTMMPDSPDIPKAYSINLQNGIGPGKKDTLRFTTVEPGKFSMSCGVPGHAASGMWDWFAVSGRVQRPSVELAI